MKNGEKISQPKIGGLVDKIMLPALILGAVFMGAGFLYAFLGVAPVNGAEVNGVEMIAGQMFSHKILLSQKIFYYHMPVAIVSFAALAFAGYYSFRFLTTKNKMFDTATTAAMQVALIFVVCTMITGELWTRFEWGVWWAWEPRLTTYLILMLIVIAYFVLRNSIDDPERRATYCSVISIIALVDVPICYMVTRVIPSSLHPVVFREGGMTGEMGMCVGLCMIGLGFLGFALYRLKLRQIVIQQRLESAKEVIDSIERV